MKIAESWLREWVDPDIDTDALAHQLTMLGHEVDGISREGGGLDGIVVAEVVAVDAHPDADRLSVCKVSTGKRKPVDVVCGAPNVVTGMKSPFATPGVTLPNGVRLGRKKDIRGVASHGMLCSAAELGLGDDADGIVALPADAPVGESLTAYLSLPDAVFDIGLTPNRGDCFSVLGIARDVAALTGAALKDPAVAPVAASTDDALPVEVVEPAGCPVFAGRVITGIDARAQTPIWMVERLRRSGLRAIHPVVDVTNYVMLELGQPLHAYDLGLVKGAIRPRLGKAGERVTLLDGKEVAVNDDTLVISDDSGVIGLAGIMGGLSTAVSDATADVFFEAAYWPPSYMAGRARTYGMHTDASMRFERGVDPTGQGRAVERATALLIEICGGKPGPLVETVQADHLPTPQPIRLRRDRVTRLLGLSIDDKVVSDTLTRLELTHRSTKDGWQVTPPPHRFDVSIEADLIEEVARVHGYDSIPETTETAALPVDTVTETSIPIERIAATLVARDYQEVITYSFIDAALDEAVSGSPSALQLSNPISSEMGVMRASLWPGLLEALAGNVARQQDRVRLFEVGKSFHGTLDDTVETVRISAAVCGTYLPEQWGVTSRTVDFFDIKSDVEALLAIADDNGEFSFEAATHPALQPGQTAKVLRNGSVVGVLGKVHPRVARRFEIKPAVFVFEFDAQKILATAVPVAKSISRFPAIRRDIAVVVDESVSADDLVRTAASAAPDLVTGVKIFDVYQGPGIEAGRKSIAIGLILQETSRTLTDDDADAAQAAALRKLQQKFAAVLRD
ncbi:MAG: phenylalanine--tRNA ligase subunit beta [Woeseiaceae bacterium]|nr:phenylalanine--tRNA ligase subunit beta [Woeseiaceae bacterium]